MEESVSALSAINTRDILIMVVVDSGRKNITNLTLNLALNSPSNGVLTFEPRLGSILIWTHRALLRNFGHIFRTKIASLSTISRRFFRKHVCR